MTTAAWLKNHTCTFAGKAVAVSGATGGLGGALCRHLAACGASLILCDRNAARSRALGDALVREYPSLTVKYIPLDLADMTSVEAAARALEDSAADTLILNAGIYHVPRYTADSGYNNIFQVNFVAPYALTRRLLPTLRARGGRVVFVGSIAHTYSATDMADRDFSTRRASSRVYGNAKRWLMTAASALAADGGVAIAHPGITLTGITAHYPKWIFALIKHPMKMLFMSPRRAALSILQVVFADTAPFEWIGPRFFRIWGLPRVSRFAIPADETARILAATQEIIAGSEQKILK